MRLLRYVRSRAAASDILPARWRSAADPAGSASRSAAAPGFQARPLRPGPQARRARAALPPCPRARGRRARRYAPRRCRRRSGWGGARPPGTMVWPCTTLKPKSVVERQEGLADPDQVVAGLLGERHPGPDAGVNEEVAADPDLERAGVEEGHVRSGKGGGEGVAGRGRALHAGVRHAVGGERGVAAHVVVQPVVGAVVPVRIAEVGRRCSCRGCRAGSSPAAATP